jgi:capsular polysaccharide transport system permease protein
MDASLSAPPLSAAPQAPASPAPVPVPGPARRTGTLHFQRLRVIFALLVREMGSTYGRSAGGYFWAIGQPLGGVVLLAVAFSLALRTPPLGTSFMLFYATGIVPFTMYNAMVNAASGVVRSNRGLLSYPVVSALDAIFATFLLNLMTQAIIGIILFAAIIPIFDLHIVLEPGPAMLALLLAAGLGLGIGTLNCVLFGFFPTWKNVWGVLTRPLFILSGVLFTFESAPTEFQKVLWFNPLMHVLGVSRTAFYGEYHPQFISLPYVLGIALTSFVVGAYLLRRHESFLIEQ